ncbi:MAG: hypothetical protein DBY37_01775 [Desulfovibrionaceae bacterium]|nr:MAG: hypothetical protein DBY37_12620 [Desulfovibrionaceae bacterium]PWL64558.1 MAG: hypothetical protein DBY37_01775 [Desulfovibrionaceae bacterium]
MDVSAGRNTGFRHAVFTLPPLPDAASELRLLRLPRPWAQLRFAERESRDESRSARNREHFQNENAQGEQGAGMAVL